MWGCNLKRNKASSDNMQEVIAFGLFLVQPPGSRGWSILLERCSTSQKRDTPLLQMLHELYLPWRDMYRLSKRENKGKLILRAPSLDLRPSATSHSRDSHTLSSPAFSLVTYALSKAISWKSKSLRHKKKKMLTGVGRNNVARKFSLQRWGRPELRARHRRQRKRRSLKRCVVGRVSVTRDRLV